MTAQPARPGISLLEVLIAMAIFLLSLVGISRLVSLGTNQALDVRFQSEASILCQAKYAEVEAGVVPLESQSEIPFEEAPDWSWSVSAEPEGSIANLWRVVVTVSREHPDGYTIENTLTGFILDPQQQGGASAPETEETSEP